MGPVGDFLGFSRVRIHDSVKKNKPRDRLCRQDMAGKANMAGKKSIQIW